MCLLHKKPQCLINCFFKKKLSFFFNLLVVVDCEESSPCKGTTALDWFTFDRSPFDPGWLSLVSDPRSIWYHWIDYLDYPVIEVKKEHLFDSFTMRYVAQGFIVHNNLVSVKFWVIQFYNKLLMFVVYFI